MTNISDITAKAIKNSDNRGLEVRINDDISVWVVWNYPEYNEGVKRGGDYTVIYDPTCWTENATTIEDVKSTCRFMVNYFAPADDKIEVSFGTFDNGIRKWAATVNGEFLMTVDGFGHKRIRTFATETGARTTAKMGR